jgi:hypothetical protein
MIHWRGRVNMAKVAVKARIARDRDVVTGQPLHIRCKRGRGSEGPAQQDHNDGEDTQGPHRAATHLPAVACPCGLDVEGWRRIWLWITWQARPGQWGFLDGPPATPA